jgi:O-antigen/teichoic acid export membrane protein
LLLKRMSAYGWTLSLSGAAMLVVHYGDRYLLRHYVSLAEIGIYSLAYKIGMIISYLQQPFDIYWRAQMFSVVKMPDGDRVYVRVCTYLTLALTGATLAITVFAKPFFEAIAGPAFRDAQYLAPWIALVYTIRVVGNHFRSVFLIEGKPRLELQVTWIASAVCLAGYVVLIPAFRLWGAVIATGIAFTWMGVQGYVQGQHLRHFPYEFKRMGLVAAAAVAVVLFHRLFDPRNFVIQVIWATVCFCLFPLSLRVVGFFTPGEWMRLVSWRQRLPGWGRRA